MLIYLTHNISLNIVIVSQFTVSCTIALPFTYSNETKTGVRAALGNTSLTTPGEYWWTSKYVMTPWQILYWWSFVRWISLLSSFDVLLLSWKYVNKQSSFRWRTCVVITVNEVNWPLCLQLLVGNRHVATWLLMPWFVWYTITIMRDK